jgi:xanthine/uracil permease
MLYKLNDKLPTQKTIIYGLQHVIFISLSTVVMPVVLGPLIGLSQEEIAEMLQRTFVLSGFVSLLQMKFGHGYPIVEAPSGLWIGILTLIAGLAPSVGKDLSTLRTDLEGGMLIAGIIVIGISAAGWIPHVTKLFTPAVNSVLILLMVIQISPSIVKSMYGISETNQTANFKITAVFFFIVIVTLSINLFARGFLQSIATLIGIIAGWVIAAFLGMTNPPLAAGKGILSLPEPLAWGPPTFDAGITVTCLLAALVLLSMTYTSIKSMAELLEEQVSPGQWKRSFALHGFTTALNGVFSVIAFMPYLSSTGFLAMTRVAARTPFALAGILMMIMGVITPIGMMLATIPTAVGCGALLVVFSLILGQGLKELQHAKLTNRESFVIGISMLVGIGTMFLPPSAFQELPGIAPYILPNGLVCGILLALILDHILPEKNEKETEPNND